MFPDSPSTRIKHDGQNPTCLSEKGRSNGPIGSSGTIDPIYTTDLDVEPDLQTRSRRTSSFSVVSENRKRSEDSISLDHSFGLLSRSRRTSGSAVETMDTIPDEVPALGMSEEGKRREASSIERELPEQGDRARVSWPDTPPPTPPPMMHAQGEPEIVRISSSSASTCAHSDMPLSNPDSTTAGTTHTMESDPSLLRRRRNSSIASIYGGRKPAPRMTESLEDLSFNGSISGRRESAISSTSSVGTFGIGPVTGVGLGKGTSSRSSTSDAGSMVAQDNGPRRSEEVKIDRSSLARRLSNFSFAGRRADESSAGRGSRSPAVKSSSSPSQAYRKVSLSTPISSPSPLHQTQQHDERASPLMQIAVDPLPPIPQSPQIDSDFVGPYDETSSRPRKTKERRRFLTPPHIVIPSRGQSLPSARQATLGNVRIAQPGVTHPHFQYSDKEGDHRLSVNSQATAEAQEGNKVLAGTTEFPSGLPPAITIHLEDIVDPVPSPRKFSDQTFNTEFSLSRGDGAGHGGPADGNGTDGSDTEMDERDDAPPTPTLMVDSGSSGEYGNGLVKRDKSVTSTTGSRRGFSGAPRPRWLEAAGHHSSAQTVQMRSASEDETPTGSRTRLGFGNSTSRSSKDITDGRRQSWQALKELEFQERHREETAKALGETRRKRGRKLRLRSSAEPSGSDDSPEGSRGGVKGLRGTMRARREKKKAEKQRFIDECDVPPSTADLFDVSLMEVLDVEGKPVPFGEVVRGGAGRKTVVVFIRHWYCPLCGEYVENIIRHVSPAALEAANVDLVIIGHGSAKMLPAYSKVFNCPFRMYTDPKLQVYKGLGMTLKTANAGADEDKGDYLERNALEGNWEVAKRATKMPMRNPGHFFQLGGEFIFKNSLHCEWAHRMTTTRNHASIMTILEVAGVINPELPLDVDDTPGGGNGSAPPVHGELYDQIEEDKVFGNWAESGADVSPAERYASEERKRSIGQGWMVDREEELERIRVQRDQRRDRMEEMGLTGCDSVVDLGDE